MNTRLHDQVVVLGRTSVQVSSVTAYCQATRCLGRSNSFAGCLKEEGDADETKKEKRRDKLKHKCTELLCILLLFSFFLSSFPLRQAPAAVLLLFARLKNARVPVGCDTRNEYDETFKRK